MITVELKPGEAKLLMDFMQNATINNINGHAMWALATIMQKLSAIAAAEEQNGKDDNGE